MKFEKFLLMSWLCIAFAGSGIAQHPLETWSARDFFDHRALTRAVKGDSGYVAVGDRQLFHSVDGLNWSAVYLPERPSLLSVAFGAGVYVAVGFEGTGYRSTDGRIWEVINLRTTNNIFDITYAFDQFLAVGGFGILLYSDDGENWLSIDTLGFETLFSIAAGPERVVAVGKDGQIYHSFDGFGWNSLVFPNDGTFESVAWANGNYLAVGRIGNGRMSTDGVSWTAIEVPDNIISLSGNADGFLAANNTPDLLYSTDGLVWFDSITSQNESMIGVRWSGEEFLVVGNDATLLRSQNGFSWSVVKPRVPGWKQRESNAQTQVALGDDGVIIHSLDDGETWEPSVTHDLEVNDVVFNDNRWWIVANAGGLLQSIDGISWTGVPIGVTNDLFHAHFATERQLIVGSAGKILSSTNHIEWVDSPSGVTGNLRVIVFDGIHYDVLGDGVAVRSNDGESWTSVGFLPEFEPRDAVADGTVVVAVGRAGKIARKLVGGDWELIERLEASLVDLTSIVHANGTFVVSGGGGLILYSYDGIDWNELSVSTNARLNAMIFDGQRFQAMSFEDLIWTSEDIRIPFLESITYSSEEGATIGVFGELGTTYSLEHTDQLSDWTFDRQFTPDGLPFQLEDPMSAPFGRRFYRIVVP